MVLNLRSGRLHEQSDDKARKLSYVTVVPRVKRIEFAFGGIYLNRFTSIRVVNTKISLDFDAARLVESDEALVACMNRAMIARSS